MRTHGLVVGLCVPAAMIAAMVGCDVAEEVEEIRMRPGWCSFCGVVTSNSATVNGADTSDIHLDQASTTGVKVRFGEWPTAHGLETFRLDVEGDQFIGVLLDDDAETVITGAQFVGAKVTLEMPGGLDVVLQFTDFASGVPSWASQGAPISAYKAIYRGTQGVYQSLCPATHPDNQWFTLIPGEVYNEANEVVTSERSVTIACVGEAAAKMKLMDFHPQGNRGASVEERQATLRMITADYCGTGHSFTVTGTPVAWRDSLSWIRPPGGEDVMEALWDQHGAICLSTPRHASIDHVLAECSIPTCDGSSFTDEAVWRTMIPSSDG